MDPDDSVDTGGVRGEDGLTLSGELADTSVLVIRVAGDLDMLTAPRLDGYVRDSLVATGASQVILDLAGVTFVGSSAVTVFIGLVRGGLDAEFHLTGVRGNGVVERAFDLMGLASLFDIRDDITALRQHRQG